MGRDIYSESYTSRQEIVPLDESTQAGAKEKPPLPGALISNGAAYRIRTYDVLIRSQTLYPAEVTPRLVDYYAHGLNNGQASFQKKLLNLIFTHLGHLTRSSVHRDIKEQSLLGALKSIGAAYRIPRIRCADPHRLRPPVGGLARSLKTLRVFLTLAPRTRFESPQCPRKGKAPVSGGLKLSWCGV